MIRRRPVETPTVAKPTEPIEPIAREIGDEILVLDEETEQVHLLQNEAAEVWREGLRQDPGISRRKLLRSATVLAGAGLTTMALPPAIAAASSGVPTTLTLSVAASEVRNSAQSAIGSDTRTVGGTGVPGQGITLFADRLNGSGGVQSTTTLGTTTTLSNGSYSISYTAPSTTGNYTFRAVSTANGTYASSTASVPVTITT